MYIGSTNIIFLFLYERLSLFIINVHFLSLPPYLLFIISVFICKFVCVITCVFIWFFFICSLYLLLYCSFDKLKQWNWGVWEGNVLYCKFELETIKRRDHFWILSICWRGKLKCVLAMDTTQIYDSYSSWFIFGLSEQGYQHSGSIIVREVFSTSWMTQASQERLRGII
jgi:hypothetical protein